jgi:hypothetical protein
MKMIMGLIKQERLRNG